MANAFVTNDDGGVLDAVAAHLIAREQKGGIQVKWCTVNSIRRQIGELLDSIAITKSLEMPLPLKRHLIFSRSLLDQKMIRTLIRLEDNDSSIECIVLEQQTFRLSDNTVKPFDENEDRDEAVFRILDDMARNGVDK